MKDLVADVYLQQNVTTSRVSVGHTGSVSGPTNHFWFRREKPIMHHHVEPQLFKAGLGEVALGKMLPRWLGLLAQCRCSTVFLHIPQAGGVVCCLGASSELLQIWPLFDLDW